MYIEKRKVGKQTKYYLAHSFREGGKIHKIRKFLGADLTPELLKERRAKAEELILEEIKQYQIIKDPLKFELSKREISLIESLQNKADIKNIQLSDKQWERFSEIFTYNTNAIEGSELNSKDVKEILEEDKWPKEKSKEDIAEVYGVAEALQYLRDTKEHLSLDLLLKIHKIIFKNSKYFAGKFRKIGEEVVVKNKVGEILHHGAPQSRVISLLKELARWYEKNRTKYLAIVLAAVVHNQFENIHPFRDGNGRVGRLILNNILLKNGLPPVNITFNNRVEYYQSLQAYDKLHDLKPTIDLLLKEYQDLKKIIG